MCEALKEIDGVSLKLKSSWVVSNERSIVHSVNIQTEDSSDLNREKTLDDIVSFETCTQLTNQSASPCSLEFQVHEPVGGHIVSLSVVSEARIVEVYGKYGEYLCTVQAEFVDDWEGMAVYMADIVLSSPSPECALKFARLKSKDEMWLYGISVRVEVFQADAQSHVNFSHVNRILKDTGQPISEKAETCKKFIQMYGSLMHGNKAQSKIPDPQLVLKMLEADCISQYQPLGNSAKNVSKCVSGLFANYGRSFQGAGAKTKDLPTSRCKSVHAGAVCVNDSCVSDSVVDTLKQYIDERCKQIETNILLKLDQKFQEMEKKQNEKLDVIIDLLSKKGNLCSGDASIANK